VNRAWTRNLPHVRGSRAHLQRGDDQPALLHARHLGHVDHGTAKLAGEGEPLGEGLISETAVLNASSLDLYRELLSKRGTAITPGSRDTASTRSMHQECRYAPPHLNDAQESQQDRSPESGLVGAHIVGREAAHQGGGGSHDQDRNGKGPAAAVFVTDVPWGVVVIEDVKRVRVCSQVCRKGAWCSAIIY